MYLVKAKVIHQVSVEMGEVCDVVEPLRHFGGTKPWVFRNDHVMAL